MPHSLKTKLHVTTDNRFLPLLQGSVRVLAEIGGLSGRDILALELATEEAFLNIREHAYPDGTNGGVFLHGEIAGGELRLSFGDEGLPFDPARIDKPAAETARESAAGSGLGLKLIHHAADEVHWINQGKHGKELRLVKRLPGNGTVQAAAPQPVETPQAPMQRYAIRPLHPDDALQVSRMFWLTYGYTYRFEQFYQPEGLLELVQEGRLVSYVAVAENGEVVGHVGMLRSGPAAMAEMVALAVSPPHRGRGLQADLTEALAAKAREMNLFGLSFGAVTSHAISQREVAKFGAQPCGLDLATISPFGFKALGLETEPPQRESFLHCFKYLVAPPPASVHVPTRHREIVRHIYANLQRPVIPGEPSRRGTQGSYAVSFNKQDNKGMILVKDADSRQWREILRATLDLIDIAGADLICLDLPLAQPETPLICEQAEEAGYFFAGIWPHEAEDSGDLLRLTRLSTKIDLTRLQFFAPFAHEIANYVGAAMKRACGGSSAP
ncbi:MAG: GNAT family N-acetyltransferase [Desulfovibrio sp.]|nr:GNAT family N-acetyltransferase [Desulfovibrio sp.]MBI4957871.1 GNAT family N-acetyltransferase [Desulfovibrio sp.]